MTKHLSKQLNSAYIAAMNKLAGRQARQKIVAYVESFEDVSFWSNILRQFETETHYFEVMLPSNKSLQKGKKTVLANDLGERLGNYMIACVDADYDYLMQGATLTSAMLLESPYVFHTYAYAIENYRCYAPLLHTACVTATMNDRRIFDFEIFLAVFSEIIWPLFVWNIWAYRYEAYKHFSMGDFFNIIQVYHVDYAHPERTLEALRNRVNKKIAKLQSQYPEAKKTYKPLLNELLSLGITPETTYLYMRGHDLFDGIVVPMLEGICDRLRREREREIKRLAVHQRQKENELSSYLHSISPIAFVLRRQNDFKNCPPLQKLLADLERFMAQFSHSGEGKREWRVES